MKIIVACLLMLVSWGGCVKKNPRDIQSFNNKWMFSLSDDKAYSEASFVDTEWRELNLPHDWSIEGAFSEKNPATVGGGALPGGIGWYRKHFTLNPEDAGKNIFVEFDGIYMCADVYINGKHVGFRPTGYVSYSYDLTSYVNNPGEENILAVRVNNLEQPNSRWYSGSGIYRNVRLVKTEKVYIPYCGTYITTPIVHKNQSEVQAVVTVKNSTAQNQKICISSKIFSQNGNEIVDTEDNIELSENSETKAILKLTVKNPILWSTENPALYTMETTLKSNDGQILDIYNTTFGIRSFSFSHEKGFELNGKPLKLKGVCLHHDLGALGAAVNIRAIERQLEIMKKMGCNSIRTSHNAPSPELMDLCDKMGFLVMEDAFDMWNKQKAAFDYSRFFLDWYKRDLTEQICRDRNHPSLIMWNIGNEVLEQWEQESSNNNLLQANLMINFKKDVKDKEAEKMTESAMLTKVLADIVKANDSTRPVTAGCNEPNVYNNLFRSGAMDIIGYNYHEQYLDTVRKYFSHKPFLFTETTSSLMTRGFYIMPSDVEIIAPEEWWKPYVTDHFSCSAYDNFRAPWGASHEKMVKVLRDNDMTSGIYVWTGFDYLGEPTPYAWPARSSYFGIVDLAGFPKDIYYMYQSEWTEKPVLHIFPHWNWQQGDTVDIWAYYNQADTVELLLNGKTMGKRTKTADCLHAFWRVPYEPGVLEAVSYKEGCEVLRRSVKTAQKAVAIRLEPDRATITTHNNDLSFVTVDVIDAEGNIVPDATNLVHFEVSGDGFLVGVDNGSPISHESFKSNSRQAFYGKCLAILQTNGKTGKITLKATSDGLTPAIVEINTK